MTGDVILERGQHQTRANGMNLMEFCAFLAGEPHSDKPACVRVPELRRLALALNDAAWPSKRDRTRVLLPYAERLMSATATPERRGAIRYKMADIAVRQIAPEALEERGFATDSFRLRGLHEIVDVATARAASIAAGAAPSNYVATAFERVPVCYVSVHAYAACSCAHAAATFPYAVAAARAASAVCARSADFVFADQSSTLEKWAVRLLDSALALCGTKGEA